MAPTITETLPLPGEVVLREGKPYVLCPSCHGGPVTDPMCAECFGAGVAPIFEAARFAFARAEAAGHFAPSVDAPHRHGNGCSHGGRKMETSVKAATPQQIALLERLVTERMPHAASMDEFQREFCRTGLHTLRAIRGGKIIARRTMSQIIDEVIQVKVPRTVPAEFHQVEAPDTTPSAQVAAEALPVVPEGNYALMVDGVVKFYEVEHGKAGTKWEGRTFLSAQGSDERYPIRNAEVRRSVLAQIAVDPRAAMALYGQELGQCGRCGRTLTSEWRKVGIGPECSKKGF